MPHYQKIEEYHGDVVYNWTRSVETNDDNTETAASGDSGEDKGWSRLRGPEYSQVVNASGLEGSEDPEGGETNDDNTETAASGDSGEDKGWSRLRGPEYSQVVDASGLEGSEDPGGTDRASEPTFAQGQGPHAERFEDAGNGALPGVREATDQFGSEEDDGAFARTNRANEGTWAAMSEESLYAEDADAGTHITEAPNEDGTEVVRIEKSAMELLVSLEVDGPPCGADAPNMKKCEFGERAMDQAMDYLGYTKLGDGGGTGLDGAYSHRESGDNAIAEAKFGDSRLGKPSGVEQMSDDWVASETPAGRESRLEAALGSEVADRLRTDGWDRYLVVTEADSLTVRVYKMGDTGR